MHNTEDTPGRTFATLIKEARARLGWTQEQLAEESDVARTTIMRWEAGRASNPSPGQLRAVCGTLGIDRREALVALGYMTGDDVDMPPPPPRPELTDSERELVQALRDPSVSERRKREIRNFVRYQRSQRRESQQDQRHAG